MEYGVFFVHSCQLNKCIFIMTFCSRSFLPSRSLCVSTCEEYLCVLHPRIPYMHCHVFSTFAHACVAKGKGRARGWLYHYCLNLGIAVPVCIIWLPDIHNKRDHKNGYNLHKWCFQSVTPSVSKFPRMC